MIWPNRKLTYPVLILVMIALLCTMITTPVYHHSQLKLEEPDLKGLLRQRAKSSWFNDHPQPLKAEYQEMLGPATKSINVYSSSEDYFNESSNESFWNNLLDVSYWNSISEQSEYESSWQDIFTIEDEKLTFNYSTGENTNTEAGATCPERSPVFLDADAGQRRIPQDLYNLAPMVFDTAPAQFLKTLRNPCWNKKDQIVCLPSFFLAGMPKAGTTDLWTKITRHPQVINTQKEPHWWTRKRIDPTKSTGFIKYSKRYSKVMQKRTRKDDSGAMNLIVGDGSASTFWDNHYWGKYFSLEACKDQGPPYVIADVIHSVLPQSKILVIFRNPTDRLYSDYIYFGGKKRTPESFHADVINTVEMFNKCLMQASLRACTYSSNQFRPKQKVRLAIGLYSVFARDWLKAFPRKQIMFLRLEDWHDMCPTILPQIFKFLELESLPMTKIQRMCSDKIRNPTKRNAGPMLDKTRQILDEFYANTRHELAAILYDNKFLWEG